MRTILTADEFARRAAERGDLPDGVALHRLSPSAPADLTESDSRIIRYVFSTGAVARDNHTINQEGWDFSGFDNYRSFLWAHDDTAPPIGNVIEHTVRNGQLIGAVKYVERDIYPFADMIFQMVKQGIVSAVSTAWRPLEWKFSTDRSRIGGIDFIRQDMLEISQVPVPAQVTAIATARSAGIDTTPMFEWAGKILDGGGMVMLPRAEVERMRRAAKMPAAVRKTKEDIMKTTLLTSSKRMARDLYDCASLAYTLSSLCYLEDNVEFEAEIEGDGSDIPARLTVLIKALGQVLVDMTEEEVAELFEEETLEDGLPTGEAVMQAFTSPAQRAVAMFGLIGAQARAFKAKRYVVEAPKAIPPAQISKIRSNLQAFIRGEDNLAVLDNGLSLREIGNSDTNIASQIRKAMENFARSGRVLSKANEDDLRSAMSLIDGVVKQVEGEPDDATARAAHAVELQHLDLIKSRAV